MKKKKRSGDEVKQRRKDETDRTGETNKNRRKRNKCEK